METSGPASLEEVVWPLRPHYRPLTSTCTTDRQLAGCGPYAPAGLRHRLARPGGRAAGPPRLQDHRPALRRGAAPHRVRAGRRARPRPTQPGLKFEYLDRRGVDRAIWPARCCSWGSAKPRYGGLRSPSASLPQDARNLGAPVQLLQGLDPGGAPGPGPGGRGDRRLGGDPGMVQVLMGGASETPLGRRQFHPIYDACVRHGLPLACTSAARARAHRRRPRRVGPPATPLRVVRLAAAGLYGPHPRAWSTEGVFEKFPRAERSCSTRAACSGCRTSCGASTRTGRRSARDALGERAAAPSSSGATARPTRWSASSQAELAEVLEMVDGRTHAAVFGQLSELGARRPIRYGRGLPTACAAACWPSRAHAIYGDKLLCPRNATA